MFREEADWILDKLKRVDLSNVRRVLNVGSGGEEFRKKEQPHQEAIFLFLKEKGIRVSHLDQKAGKGVDIVADIKEFSPPEPYDLIFLTNVLEHLRNPEEVAKRVFDLLVPGGYLVVSVPKFYRRHPDPIDTGFRPDIKELKDLFPNTSSLFSEVLRIKRPRDKIGRLLALFGIHWQVSCLFLKKTKVGMGDCDILPE